MKFNRYHVAAISAFVIWGFIPFPLKALHDFPSSQILYFRVLVAVLTLLVVSGTTRREQWRQTLGRFKGQDRLEKRRFILFTLLGGALLAINWLAFIYVVNHVDIQTGSFSYLLCPILTAVLGFLILREHLRVNQWFSVGLSFMSCLLVGTDSLYNLLFGLLIAASYAFYLITQRLLKDYDKIVLLTLQLLLAFLFIGPSYPWFVGEDAQPITGHFVGQIVLLSWLFTVIPLFLNLYALKELKSATVGVLMYLNPIINFTMAFLYFGEVASQQKIIAYGVIFLSVILYNLPIGKKQEAQPVA
ncbi:EamA family transporter [Rufibacter glacialis]|uniref:EamA family transporter n=1 Tax=Rufibacter glacialis TaxID=1259555 RepID=A0A5M8QDU4_9BACT|nr:EamA family transporter [Rufibacter glacialis]KAA6433348.1 EamA family transporter [Rufibacter glacialis]GGK75098.1 permease [Rufibacter glacialis]